MFPLTSVFRPIWAKFSFMVLLLVILNLIVISGSLASLKEECDSDWDCGENAVCGYNRCICKMGYKENSYSDGCRIFSCKNDVQCNIFGWNTHCSIVCYCDNGYSANPNTQQCEQDSTPSYPSSTWPIIRIILIVFGAANGFAIIVYCCRRVYLRRRQASSSTTVTVLASNPYSQPQFQYPPSGQSMPQPQNPPMPVPVSNPYSPPQFQYPPSGQSMPQPQNQPMPVSVSNPYSPPQFQYPPSGQSMPQPQNQPMPVSVSNPYSQPQFQYPQSGHSMPQPQYPPMSVPYQPGRTDESNQWSSLPSQPNNAAPSAPPNYFESVADQTSSQNPDYSSRTQTKY